MFCSPVDLRDHRTERGGGLQVGDELQWRDKVTNVVPLRFAFCALRRVDICQLPLSPLRINSLRSPDLFTPCSLPPAHSSASSIPDEHPHVIQEPINHVLVLCPVLSACSPIQLAGCSSSSSRMKDGR